MPVLICGDLYLEFPIWPYGVQRDIFTSCFIIIIIIIIIIIVIIIIIIVSDTRNSFYAITNSRLQPRAMFSRAGSQWMGGATWRNGVNFNRYNLLVETALGLGRMTRGLFIV